MTYHRRKRSVRPWLRVLRENLELIDDPENGCVIGRVKASTGLKNIKTNDWLFETYVQLESVLHVLSTLALNE